MKRGNRNSIDVVKTFVGRWKQRRKARLGRLDGWAVFDNKSVELEDEGWTAKNKLRTTSETLVCTRGLKHTRVHEQHNMCYWEIEVLQTIEGSGVDVLLGVVDDAAVKERRGK